MTRRSVRTSVVLAAVGLIGLIGAGCGASTPSETGTTSRTGAARKATPQDKAVKFAECMRNHGVSDFPDPDASGELTIDGIANGSSVDPSSAAFERAIVACKDLQPPGFTGRKRSAEQQAAGLKFAQCIRDNGVADFPDPTADAPLVDTNRIPSANAPGGMAILNAAMRKCGDAAASAGVTAGR